MTFIWPFMLFSLVIVPVIVVAYVLLYNRRRARAGGLSGLGGQPQRGPGPRRHLPPALFLLSLVILLVALARPQAKVTLPRVEGTVILVFDVSASMGATDVQPSRLEAAKAAAREFVTSQPSTVKIGIVSFSGAGFAVQQPTNDTDALLSTISRLKPTAGTSLGQGIITGLSTIAADAGLSAPATPTPDAQAAAPTPQPGQQGAPGGPRLEDLLARLPDGRYPASEIVLLTDGENNQSIDPVEAAKAALTHNVRVYALGFGTTAGTTLQLEGFSVHTALDEGTLQQVTDASGGAYFPAQSDTDPKDVYAKLTPQLVVKPQTMEVTSIFAGAGILIMLAASLLSMVWFNRLP
jgi:Ca-activated chloride channel homolog